MSKALARNRLYSLPVVWMMVYAVGFSQPPTGMISGKIVNRSDGCPLPSCNVTVYPGGRGSISDSLGMFRLRVPYGLYRIEFSYVGFKTQTDSLLLSETYPHRRFIVEMVPELIEGQSVTVLDRRQSSAAVQTLQKADIRRMPSLYSEVLRTVKILPGVTSNNELSSAYNVRGGNYDENLIYLNGYEIYRPFLLRQGQEESQSLINPDLVQALHFHSGAFPAQFGDKLSSVLEIDYAREYEREFGGTVRGDLLNFAVAAHHQTGKLSWSGGIRYANPELLVNRLQTSGTYRPLFADLQLLVNYALSARSGLELFLLQAYNRFDLTPDRWTGNFKEDLFNVRAIDIDYAGERTYSFHSGLIGLKYRWQGSPRTYMEISLARYGTGEKENIDLLGSVYFRQNAAEPQSSRRLLKTRREIVRNSLDLFSYQLQASLHKQLGSHLLHTGIDTRIMSFENRLDELFFEEGEQSLQETPLIAGETQDLRFTYLSGFVQDHISLNQSLRATVGLRAFHYRYNGETLFSPRAGLRFFPGADDILMVSWGYYHQPPFFYELRNKDITKQPPLKSQRAIHYVIGWEHRFKKHLTFQAEAYYKQLEWLIPYYIDQLKLVYAAANNQKGYAYGLDLLIQGQLVKSMNSWISYSYLNTREKLRAGISGYRRRLLDQTHTLRLFLQDQVPRYPNLQAHVRLLFGSGFLYHPRQIRIDDPDQQALLAVDFASRKKFQYYARADLGLSAQWPLDNRRTLLLTAEVFNVFNHINVASYSWFQIFANSREPIRVPQIFTRRFFNLSLEFNF